MRSRRASTDAPGGASPSAGSHQLWRPAGVAFLGVSLAALAAGVFPELLLQPDRVRRFAHPPTLQVLLAAQAGFLMLLGPLVLARRRDRRSWPSRLPTDLAAGAGEFLMLLIASAPLYWAAGWLSDATAVDVIRGVLYLTGVALAAWALSLWALKGGAWSTAAALAGAIVAVGMPVSYYLLAELTELAVRPGWLWSAAPVTCAFSVAASRQAAWHPAPLWAWALWPIVAAALGLALLLAGTAEPEKS